MVKNMKNLLTMKKMMVNTIERGDRMSRLTKKIDNGYVLPIDKIKVDGYLKAIEKLGKLEELEK